MWLKAVYFTSLLFTALSLAPGLAHLLELPNKIHLPAQEYLTVQQIYRGWALLGIALFLAFASNLALTVMTRHIRAVFFPEWRNGSMYAGQPGDFLFVYIPLKPANA
jgi:hypothetical protein